jgi:hypothetical protein
MVQPLTEKHLVVFGLIITSFARLEWLIQITIAAVGRLDFATTLIVTRSLPYKAKRDTLYALLNKLNMPENHKTEIKDFLDAADKLNTLRNNIAHAMWTAGKRPGSIKPMTILVQGGSGRYIGIDDSDKDYTIDELVHSTDKLAIINNSYLNFLRAAGYTASIEQKILETMDAKTSADGA